MGDIQLDGMTNADMPVAYAGSPTLSPNLGMIDHIDVPARWDSPSGSHTRSETRLVFI